MNLNGLKHRMLNISLIIGVFLVHLNFSFSESTRVPTLQLAEKLDVKETEGLMVCELLGYSEQEVKSEIQARVYCPTYEFDGWISNKVKIHSIGLYLYMDGPGFSRSSVGPIAYIKNPDQSKGLRQLFHSLNIFLAGSYDGLFKGTVLEIADKNDYYALASSYLVKAIGEFNQKNPKFLTEVYNKDIHQPFLGQVWIPKDVTIYAEARSDSMVMPKSPEQYDK